MSALPGAGSSPRAASAGEEPSGLGPAHSGRALGRVPISGTGEHPPLPAPRPLLTQLDPAQPRGVCSSSFPKSSHLLPALLPEERVHLGQPRRVPECAPRGLGDAVGPGNDRLLGSLHTRVRSRGKEKTPPLSLTLTGILTANHFCPLRAPAHSLSSLKVGGVLGPFPGIQGDTVPLHSVVDASCVRRRDGPSCPPDGRGRAAVAQGRAGHV